MKSIESESLKYDLTSLINLQNKRCNNISIFQQSIKNEREILIQEETIQATLESKLRLHDAGINKLCDTDYQLILLDLPKIKSTRSNRDKTIALLKHAIIEEQNAMDYEERMIAFLESHGNKN